MRGMQIFHCVNPNYAPLWFTLAYSKIYSVIIKIAEEMNVMDHAGLLSKYEKGCFGALVKIVLNPNECCE